MIKRALLAAVGLYTLLAPAHALADEGGFEGGLRAGYGVPFGKATDDAVAEMNELTMGVVPVWVDAGYRVSPQVFIGAYFLYGFGINSEPFGDSCDVFGDDCSTSSLRIGAQVHVHPWPRSSIDPWFGYGFGYELWSVKVEGAGESSLVPSGFEFVNLQFGHDFTPASHFYVGPFFSVSVAQFHQVDAECSGARCTDFDPGGSIEDKSLHGWVVFGIRGGYTGFDG